MLPHGSVAPGRQHVHVEGLEAHQTEVVDVPGSVRIAGIDPQDHRITLAGLVVRGKHERRLQRLSILAHEIQDTALAERILSKLRIEFAEPPGMISSPSATHTSSGLWLPSAVKAMIRPSGDRNGGLKERKRGG